MITSNGQNDGGECAAPRGTGWMVLTGIGAAFFGLNVIVPRFADDYCRTSTLFDLPAILTNLQALFLEWTGRIVVMFINRVVFSTGEPGLIGFALANGAMLAWACGMALDFGRGHGNARNKFSTDFAVLTVFLFLFWSTPQVVGEVALWKTGAIQYLWAVVLALAMLRVLLRPPGSGTRVERARLAGYLLLCVFAGNWLENLSLAVAITWSLVLAAQFAQGKGSSVAPRAWLGWIGWCTGAALLFGAPGNYVRAGGMDDGLGLIGRLPATLGRLLETVDPGTLAIYLLFVSLQFLGPAPDRKERLRASLLFASVALLSTLVMAGAPLAAFVRRVGFPTEFFLIVAAICVFPAHLLNSGAERVERLAGSALRIGAGVLAGLLALELLLAVPAYYSLDKQAAARLEWLAAVRERGFDRVDLFPLVLPDGRSTLNGQINEGGLFARDITTDPRSWKNSCYARAMGLASVRLIARQ